MKNVFFLVVLFMLSISPAAAQDYYLGDDETSADDINDYNYDLDEDLVLTDNQWHLDGTSILEANNNQYLVVQGQNRVRRTLYQPDYDAYGRLWNGYIDNSSARPYYYNGNLGWAILCNALWYFIYPDGNWCRFSSSPNYYTDYYYPVRNCRHLNFYDWHFWQHRHHYNYHGHCYDRPRYNGYYRYNNGHFHYNDRRHSSSYRGRDANSYQSSRNSGYERSSVRSNSGSTRRENVVRSSGSSSRYQGTTTRPSSSDRRSSGVTTRPASSGNSYQGTTSRPSRSSSGSSNYSRPARSESSRSSYQRGSSSGSSRSSATSPRSSSSSSGSSRSSRR